MRALVLAMLASACTGTPSPLAIDEPVRARGAQFVAGPLPGDDPDDNASGEPRAITIVESANSAVELGQASKKLGGRTSTDAVAVAVAFATLGDGYWVQPLGPPDPTAGNEYTFAFDLELGWDLPLGAGALELVAIDDAGVAGRRRRVPVCVLPRIPDNFNACDATSPPPDTVITLDWDTSVDLDLVVRAPDGGFALPDRDSNRSCQIDGLAREDVVFQDAPVAGTYLVFARLADACGQSVVHLRATIYRRTDTGLVEAARQDGVLLAGAAGGPDGVGLFLLQITL